MTANLSDSGDHKMIEPIPRLRTVLWRGMRRRCPHCGKGPIYLGWVKLHDRCPACGLKYLSDQGDLWAYLVAVDRALFVLPLIVLIYFRLYLPDSIWFYVFTGGLMFSFIYTLPHRNGMALGADYLIRRHWGDLAEKESASKTNDPK
jgi:uncharacterized protein (DUF983 family)